MAKMTTPQPRRLSGRPVGSCASRWSAPMPPDWQRAPNAHMSYMAFLAEVLTAEVDERAERRRQWRVTEARLPRIKGLADVELGAAPTINPATIATLASCAYLDAGEPVVLLGDSGTGNRTC
jgi:DNA replication protein DnaC